MRNLSQKLEKFGHLTGIVFGFALGQGAALVLHLYLTGLGHAAFVGELCVGMGVITIVQSTSDLGGLFLMSDRNLQGLDRRVASANLVRLVFAVILVLVVPFATRWLDSPLASGIVDTGKYVALIWALNLTGVLDGLGKSYVAGPFACGPWLFSTVAAFFVAPSDTYSAGVSIGVAYVVGAAVTVIIHYVIAKRMYLCSPAWDEIRTFAVNGFLYTSLSFVSLIYGRVLLFLVYSKLDGVITGYFALTRSLLSGLQQLITFVRRIEFPDLKAKKPIGTVAGLWLQRVSLQLSVLPLILFVMATWFLDLPNELWALMFAFLGLLPIWCIYSAMGQIFIAENRTGINLFIATIGSLASIAIAYACFVRFGVFATVLGEALKFTLMTVLYVGAMRIRSRSAVNVAC